MALTPGKSNKKDAKPKVDSPKSQASSAPVTKSTPIPSQTKELNPPTDFLSESSLYNRESADKFLIEMNMNIAKFGGSFELMSDIEVDRKFESQLNFLVEKADLLYDSVFKQETKDIGSQGVRRL